MAAQLFQIEERARERDLRAQPLRHKVLINLLKDTGMPVLVMLSEKYGLRRVPGLGKQQIIQRILRNLQPEALDRLEVEMIAARFGQASVDDLLALVLEEDARRSASRPHMDEVSRGDAILIERSARRWVYTMRGHDVTVDMDRHVLACDCPFFAFASKRERLCKHLATALKLLPPVYAREVLIDLAVARRYDGEADRWEFASRAA